MDTEESKRTFNSLVVPLIQFQCLESQPKQI